MNLLAAVKPLSNQKGMKSCNLYNTSPAEPETSHNHPLCANRKLRNFPHFSYPPATPRQWITHMDTTNSTFSRFTIVNDKESYSVCDQLELLIEARNGYDEPKTYGGDLFRSKIFTQNGSFIAGSGTDGEVLDLGNGSYSAFFTLKWAGTIRINVTLVVPSEAVFELQNLKETLQPRENYLGKFSKKIGGKDVAEEVRCGHVPVDRLTSICNLSNPYVGLTWYCQKPNSSLLSCSDWTAFKTLEWQFNKRIEDEGYSRRSSVVHRRAAPIVGHPNHVTVNGESGDFINEQVDRLPVCGQQHDRLQVIPWVTGFYRNKRWSFYEQRIKSIADAARRLLNRNPTAVVMFKGGNTQNPYGPRSQYLNEHYARDNEEALRRILKSYPKIHFLDAWDMSKGQLALADTHPPEPHASNLIDQILTIACPI
ncbi:NXPE family member 3-like [Strongylocentrotus purpuratus]|uniref:NXPE C-terminal domain-containing protein n=1 Tax=Strongylocentrotus purpuratus TaxID=7668 RepID=A0A7M7N5E6_STRPU|nr:NXPE family member 3-like [Strongylocentrotus purpuratus]